MRSRVSHHGGKLTGIRIARVSTVPYFVVTQLRQQLDYLADQAEALVYVVTSPGRELRQIKERPNLHKLQIEISRGISPLRDMRTLVRLFLFFRRNRIDIVHSTTPKAGLLCAVAAFCARVPVRLHTFTGQPWVNLTGWVRCVSVTADRVIAMLNTRCYADSRSQANFLVQNNIIPEDRVDVIGRGSLAGVDLARFAPETWNREKQLELRGRLNISEDAFVVLFVGRITRDKGIAELIEAFGRVAELEQDVNLVLIGPLDEEAGGRATVAREQLERHPAIHYLGYRSCPEKYMAMADILCLPSYREGFGTVVIEAAAMETATVASRIYGLTDAVVDGETGILVPPGDVSSLASTIHRLVQDRELCRRLGKNARKHVESCYDAQKMNVFLAQEYASLAVSDPDGQQ